VQHAKTLCNFNETIFIRVFKKPFGYSRVLLLDTPPKLGSVTHVILFPLTYEPLETKKTVNIDNTDYDEALKTHTTKGKECVLPA